MLRETITNHESGNDQSRHDGVEQASRLWGGPKAILLGDGGSDYNILDEAASRLKDLRAAPYQSPNHE